MKTAKISETITENIFRKFYEPGMFIEKSAIPSHYGFKSKKKTTFKGYPDFFRDEEEEFVIIVEAKADNYEAACEEVKWYAQNNKIEKDVIAISISGQTEASYKAGLYFIVGEGDYTEVPTDGKLLPLKDIIKLYRKCKYGESTSADTLKNTIQQLNKEFQNNNIKDTERSLFFAGLMIALKDSTFAKTYKSIQSPTDEEREASQYRIIDSHNLNTAILEAIVRQISNKINNHSKEYNWKDRFSFIKNIDYPLVEYKKLINKIEKKSICHFD